MAPHTSDNQKADEATMTTVIRQDDLIESVADALQFISYYHPKDFIQAVYEAYQKEESQAAKDAMAQILINSRMCAQGHRPICQDTGIVTVFVNIGMDVKFECDMALDDVINEGVRRAYTHPDNVLRASVLRATVLRTRRIFWQRRTGKRCVAAQPRRDVVEVRRRLRAGSDVDFGDALRAVLRGTGGS